QHSAVGINMHQGTGLVEVRRREGDSELDRCQCQAAPYDGVRGIPLRDGHTAPLVGAFRAQAADDVRDHIVLELLAIRRDIALTDPVKILPAHSQRVERQMTSDLIKNLLNDHHALWAAKTPEG